MTALKDFAIAHADTMLALGGLALGVAFGAIVMATNFCTMGGLSDIAVLGDWRRFRAWLLAAGVAMIGAQAMAAAGIVDLGASIYLGPRLNWLGHLGGGVMFGVGMVLAGGCASRNLARIGAGDLRALFVVVVVGVTGFATITGVLAPLRVALDSATALDLAAYGWASQRLDAAFGDPSPVVGLVLGGFVTAWALASPSFLRAPRPLLSGIGIGLLIILGWLVTGFAHDALALSPRPTTSLTFVRPAGEALDWLQRAAVVAGPGFGAASVLGTVAGAFLVARAKRQFRWQTFADTADTGRALAGAVLMGAGGVTALGCTIGQGLTGLSTLALGAVLTLAAIIVGGVIGLRLLARLVAD